MLLSAQTALNQGRFAEAEQQLRTFLATHPKSTEGLYAFGETLFRENKPKESLAVYTQAASQRRPSAHDLRFVGLDYVLLNDYTDADKWMTESLRLNSRDGESWYALGRIKYTENRFSEAVISFQKALELMPQSVKAEDNLGLTYEGLNQPDQAISAYRQAIRWAEVSGKPSEQPLLNLGTLLIDRNQIDEAEQLLRRAATIAPNYGKTHAALGKLYARKGEFTPAQNELEKAIAADPQNSGLHFQLGQVFRKQGMADRATEELSRAATLEREQRQH